MPLGGRRCEILRTEPVNNAPAESDEIWVDPAQDYSVSRYVRLAGKNPAFRIDTEYQSGDHGWLAKKWVLTSMSGSKVATVSKLTVTAIEINPPISDEQFTVPLKPGMSVVKYTYPQPGSGLDPALGAKEKYVVAADGSLTRMGATGFTTLQGRQLPPDSGWPWWAWVALAAVCATAFIAGAVYWRKRAVRKAG